MSLFQARNRAQDIIIKKSKGLIDLKSIILGSRIKAFSKKNVSTVLPIDQRGKYWREIKGAFYRKKPLSFIQQFLLFCRWLYKKIIFIFFVDFFIFKRKHSRIKKGQVKLTKNVWVQDYSKISLFYFLEATLHCSNKTLESSFEV